MKKYKIFYGFVRENVEDIIEFMNRKEVRVLDYKIQIASDNTDKFYLAIIEYEKEEVWEK